MRTLLSLSLNRALPVAAAVLAAAAALPAHASVSESAPASRTAAPAADHPTYIVTIRHGLDPADIAQAYGITPIHVFRTAMNGFAAPLSPEQVEALRATAIVESVEEDGTASPLGTAV
ncbi:protease inhibitor I9 family protein [Streptomyces sp. NPDC059874]|uniref:protease inhibitor I9 family protein n=1 Tax=Streptomyces sp. NPDC059874 TaxID=3346983 RepID=UPI003653C09F